jgi:hypothetical protein
VLFGPDLRVVWAALIPASKIEQIAKYRKHTNAWIVVLSDAVWQRPGVQDVTEALRAVEATLA